LQLGWFQFSETREVIGVFLGNNPDHKREGRKGADYQISSRAWVQILPFLFTASHQICLGGRSL